MYLWLFYTTVTFQTSTNTAEVRHLVIYEVFNVVRPEQVFLRCVLLYLLQI